MTFSSSRLCPLLIWVNHAGDLKSWQRHSLSGAKNAFCAPFLYQFRSMYQDRLGTNRGRVKKIAFRAGVHNRLAPSGMPTYSADVNCTDKSGKRLPKGTKCSDHETLGYTSL